MKNKKKWVENAKRVHREWIKREETEQIRLNLIAKIETRIHKLQQLKRELTFSAKKS